MNRSLLTLLLFGLVLPSTHAATLRLYPNFAEIREGVPTKNKVLELSFTPTQVNQIVGGSLYLSGPKVLSRLQTVSSGQGALERFEGKTVYLREDGKVRPVRLIRASDGLVQDLKTGRYRSGVSVGQLEFSTPLEPSSGGKVRYRYALDSSKPANVSYITRALSWSPRYELSVSGADARLEAFADLRNGGETLKVDSSEIIAGQVQLNFGGGNQNLAQDMAQLESAPRAVTPSAGKTSAVQVRSGSEGQGLYTYKLSQGYTLPGASTFSLPFLNPKVKVKRVARLESYFGGEFSKGKLERVYRMNSSVLLPAGNLFVRDAERVVGGQNIPTLAAGEDIDLRLGSDPDLSYVRYAKSSSESKVKKFGKVQRTYTYTTFQVTLQLQNAKARPVYFEVLERLGGQNITLEGDVGRTAQGLSLRGTLPAKGSLERKYKVTFTEIGEPIDVVPTPKQIPDPK